MDWISNLTDASSIKEDETNNMHATIFALKKQNEIKQKKTAIKSNYVFFSLFIQMCLCCTDKTKTKRNIWWNDYNLQQYNLGT